MSTHIPPLASYMHGTEYEAVNGIFPGMQDHNVPCAVCYTDGSFHAKSTQKNEHHFQFLRNLVDIYYTLR